MEELYLEICFQEREDTLIIDVPEEHLELMWRTTSVCSLTVMR